MSNTDTAARQLDRLRVAVVGAGAIGGVLGARLQQAGHDVTFIARGATLAALKTRGLVLESVDGNLTLPSVQVTADPSTLGVVDIVLVCVKATQIASLAPSLRPLVGPSTAVIPVQNGVEASGLLAAALGEGNVLEGLGRVLVEQVDPGHILHTAVTPIVEFGRRAGAPVQSAAYVQIDRFAAALRGAGLVAILPDDMGVALWEKFLFIEPIGAVGAAARVPFGVVRSVPESRALIDAALHEVRKVGQAVGVAWPADSMVRVWARYDSLPPDGSTSLQRDLMAERPSEFDAQTGAVVRIGRAHGVPTPVHDVLYAVLLPTAQRATY
ncbi:2-dehydropantoate 2-reductase [Gemmatimonas sp.]|uniref:2-dehydropantoate 2-reductase n=1 Tax=Gemmatimonas sp. TaxID=1962908 RepID=UPI0035671D26